MSAERAWAELIRARERLRGPAVPGARQVDPDVKRVDLPIKVPADVAVSIGLCAGLDEAWRDPKVLLSAGASDEPEGVFCYGSVSFMGLEEINDEYQAGLEMMDGGEQPGVIVGPVRPTYFHPARLPFARDIGAGRFLVDLDPDTGGTVGQVIWIDIEASVARVISRSIEWFFEYGRDCLRYEAGELEQAPEPFIERHGLESSPKGECARVLNVWARIVAESKARPHTSEFGLEFHKPSSTEQVEKVEARLGAPFPADLRCFYSNIGISHGMWLQPGRFGAYPMAFGGLSDVASFDRTVRDEIRDGLITFEGLPPLPKDARFAVLGKAGWTKEKMSYYVVCTKVQHELTGKVLMLYATGTTEVFKPFVDGVPKFLEQGLALILDSGAASPDRPGQ